MGGRLLRAARANPEARFAGIDHAADLVAALARRSAPLIEAGRLELRTGESSGLPWPDGSFDGAYAVHTIYFWPAPERDLAEARRVLRTGGRLLLGFRERTAEAEAAFPAPTYRFRSADEVVDLLKAAGMAASLVKGPSPGLWIARRRCPLAGALARPRFYRTTNPRPPRRSV